MIQVDTTKAVYLFTHGRRDLEQAATDALVANGFTKDKISSARPDAVGNIGDYMAMLWMPPTPDHIKIQKITKVEAVKGSKIKKVQPMQNNVKSRKLVTVKNQSEVGKEFEIKKVQPVQNNEKSRE